MEEEIIRNLLKLFQILSFAQEAEKYAELRKNPALLNGAEGRPTAPLLGRGAADF